MTFFNHQKTLNVITQCITISISILFGIVSITAYSQTQYVTTQYQQQKNQIQSSIDQINNNLAERSNHLHDISEQKASLQEEIASRENEIAQLNENITQAKIAEGQLQLQIDANQTKRDALYAQMEDIVPELQKESRKTGIQTVIEAENIGQLMRRIFGLSTLQVELENIDVQLEQLNAELAQSKKQQEEIRTALESSVFLMQSEQDSLKVLLERTQGEEARYQQLIADLQFQQQQQKSQIQQLDAQYQAELDRIAAEEARARQAANQNTSNTGNSNTNQNTGGGNTYTSPPAVPGNCPFENGGDIGVRLAFPAQSGIVSQAFNCSHDGIDIASSLNTPILAAYTGTVVDKSGSDCSAPTYAWYAGFGCYIRLRHTVNGLTFYTLYAHLNNASNVSVGTTVSTGAVIGSMGTTGYSTGVHLHFMVISGTSKSCNPAWGGGSLCYNPARFF